MDRQLIPVACTLDVAAAGNQVMEWQDLVSQAVDRDSVDGGVALTFPSELEAPIRDLAAREAACCRFLSIETKRIAGRVQLTITTESPDGQAVIEMLTNA